MVAEVTEPDHAGAAVGTLEITPSIVSWAESFPGVSGDPGADDDGDGWKTLAEYLLNTSPIDASSVPRIIPVLDGASFELQAPSAVARPDAMLSAETSIDLQNWTTDGIAATAAGFAVPRDGPQRYLRLVFELSP